ncbi:MAG: aminomethyl transferase family protein [Gammaproteobacteria bacterium]|nr:aminomethyl transferase family protein [Gammaproteobacteria bacterium]
MNSVNKIEDPYAGERLKKTHFHPRQEVLNIRESWFGWNGYKIADSFYDGSYEYFCIRNSCATYDICPMQKYIFSGKDAFTMLNRMVTRDITTLKVGRVTYLCWCTDDGRMIDDGTLFRLSEDSYLLTSGSPNLAWLKKSSYGFDDLTITDVSDDLAGLAFQGPTTCEVLKKMGLEGIENLKPFNIEHFSLNGSEDKPLMISRTGFTGDLGYELWIKPELALDLWDALYAAGEDYGIQPYGEAALSMARLEAGFILPLLEFNESLKTINYHYDQSPLELNLGWLVDFKKPHFNGRSALLKCKEEGPVYSLVKLNIEGNKPAPEAILYSSKSRKQEIGYITSAMWSPLVKANIALAMIKTKYLKGEIWAEIYYTKELRYHQKIAKCQIQKKPFWMPARGRQTPPLPY